MSAERLADLCALIVVPGLILLALIPRKISPVLMAGVGLGTGIILLALAAFMVQA
jgi:hypothetical protein